MEQADHVGVTQPRQHGCLSPNTMEYIATFGSTHKALKAEKVLKEKDIPFKLMPTSKKLAAFCDLSIAFEEKERQAVMEILKDFRINTTIYRKEGDEYVKMQLLRQRKRNSDKGSP